MTAGFVIFGDVEDNSTFMENFSEATSLLSAQEDEEVLQNKWEAEVRRWEEVREMYKKKEEVKQLEASQHESVNPRQYLEKPKSIYFDSSLYVPFNDPNRELRWYEKLLLENSSEKHTESLETADHQNVEPEVLKSPERDKEEGCVEKESMKISVGDIVLEPGGEEQRIISSEFTAVSKMPGSDVDTEIISSSSQCSSQVEESQTVISLAEEKLKKVLGSAQTETRIKLKEKMSEQELPEVVMSALKPQENQSLKAASEQVTNVEEADIGTESVNVDIEYISSPSQHSLQLEELQTVASAEEEPKEFLGSVQMETTQVVLEETFSDKVAELVVSPHELQEEHILEAVDEEVTSREKVNRDIETLGKDDKELSDPTVAGAAAAATATLEEEEKRHQVAEDTKDVKVGTLIAVLAPEGEDWKSVEIPKLEEAAGVSDVAPTTPAAPPAPAGTPSVAAAAALPAVAPTSHGNFGPSVRLLLEKFGLGEEQVPPSGPHGKLLKGDVLKLVKEKNIQPIALASVPPPEAAKPAAAAPAPVTTPAPPVATAAPVIKPGDGYRDIELTNMRRTIAKRLMQSKGSVAHSYGTIDCSIDKLVNMRKQFKKDGVKVSMNDLIIKAVAVALQQCPEMNCVWQGNQLVHSETVDISIAVATDAGLITPIVKNADVLGVQEIAEKVRDLAGRARENKLKLEEFQGGSFTISNLGMFGISEFSAIINPPQCGILAVGGGRLTVDESGSLSTRMSATLSYDRLGVDDDSAAVFLSILKDLLEEPKTLMLGALPIAQLARGLL